ncbi:2-isopropylmalate synthase [Corallincola luteus]|uniref:2-isopropylmalate synthase n=1 Tax=Corallincola luteus TaxID=1775177 RepID=A0ABY2APK2_9GAMM|nr:2-isopropylmalate synthase [Corallincola luteus]TCI04839.1 2-isopropylmalate synthase [Corallincola luteus]
MSDQVIIFDTTLRDGEQALSASLTVREKLQIALALERLGVDVMEVGFPVSSPGDFESVQTIANTIKNSRVCALSRAVEKDIDAAGEALRNAAQGRIHTFISTSTIHVESKLKRNFDDVLAMGINAVKHARRYTDDVEFSCEDAGRTPIDNLCRMVEAAITAGATTVNIPDTVGYTIPSEFGGIIQTLFNRVPNIDKAIISVHCHNDLGLAVANSISAVQQGARQIECTVNGIGERAGNCSMEEVAMIINTRKDMFPNVTTDINTKEIYRTSQMVSQLCNMPVQSNKAIVGANAFSHSSGIHQDGVLKAKNTYEIITPESIGLSQNVLNLTSRSGRHVIKHRMAEMGYGVDDYNMDELYAAFLKLADKKGQVFDYDLEALVFFTNMHDADDYYHLDYLSAQSGTGIMSTSSVKLRAGDKTICEAATGNGPVDAVYQAISRATNIEFEMKDYHIGAKGAGEDALGQVDIVALHNGRRFHGMGLATDVIEASAQAMVHVLNHIHRAKAVEAKKQEIQDIKVAGEK